jgi:hypothetical protein
MLNNLESGGVEREVRFRRIDLTNVCTADTIATVSASTHGYVCALANTIRLEMLRDRQVNKLFAVRTQPSRRRRHPFQMNLNWPYCMNGWLSTSCAS